MGSAYIELGLTSSLSRANVTDPAKNSQYALTGGMRIYELELISATIPYSWYNVLAAAPATNAIRFTEDGGGTWIDTTIPDGNYSAFTITAAIETAMNTASVIGNTYDCSVSTTTAKFTVQETSGPNNFGLDVLAGSVFYELLGFNIGIVMGATTHTGDNVVFLYPDNYLAIKMTRTDLGFALGTSWPDNGIYTNVNDFNPATATGNFYAGLGVILAEIPINENFGEIVQYVASPRIRIKLNQPIENIIELDLFSANRAVDLNGADWSCKIGIIYDRTGAS